MLRLLLLLLAVIEILLLTYWTGNLDAYIGPFIFLGIAISIAIVYWLSKTRTANTQVAFPKPPAPLITVVQVILFGAISIGCYLLLHSIIVMHPVSATDTSQSDVIPSIMQMAEHLSKGERVYQPVAFATYSYSPTYLPMMWLPYIIAVWGDFDFRYITALVFWLASLYYFFNAIKKEQHYDFKLQSLIVPIVPLLLWYAVADSDAGVIASTTEALIAGYYLLLTMALGKKKIILISLALGCCLLSRYSILLWLPLPVIVLLISKQSKSLGWVSAITILFIGIVYWLPFFRNDPQVFMRGYDSYTNATIGEWTNARNGGMWHLGNGFGFSAWMLRLHQGWQIPDIVARYQKIHLAACIGVTALLSTIYIIRRKAIQNPYPFLLMSLKIYLAIFYAFVQIPYKYLMLVPVVVSAALLSDSFRVNGTDAQNSK